MNMDITPADEKRILEDFKSGDNDKIRSAAFEAGDLLLESSIPFLCEHLASDSLGVQEGIEYALRKIRGPLTIKAILPFLNHDNAQIRNIVMDTLREIGVDDISQMESYLFGDDADIRIFISDILGYCRSHQSAVLLGEALIKDPEVNVRYQAAVSLGNLAYPESVSTLCQAMQDEEWVQFAVVEALAKIGEASAVKALVQMLPKASLLVSSAIIDALGDIGDIKSIPLLLNALENVNVVLRHKIVKAIVQILSGRSLTLLPEKSQQQLAINLLDALLDNDEEIQIAALQGLGSIGDEEASSAILDLAISINPDRSPDLYEEAIRSIASIGYNAIIRDALRSDDEARIMIAMEACQLMDDHRVIEELKNLFWRVGRELQRAAVTEVAQLGNCDDVPFFLSVMDESKDAEILKSALIFFGNQHSCSDIEDVVFAQLDHKYPDVREMALEACINLHSDHLNNRFRELFHSEDSTQRMMAVYALGRYSVTENLEEITAALEDPDSSIRRVAVEAFANLDTAAERYLPRLMPRLFDEDKDVRIALIDLFGQIGTSAVMPHLLTALKDENDWVKIRAIDALGSSKNQESITPMTQMLSTANPMVTFKIIEALGKIGGNSAFSVLLGLMDHEDPEIQHAAAEAVAAIQAGQE